MFKKLSLIAGLSLLANPAIAQWSAGFAVIVPGAPYLDTDVEVQPIPIVAYEGERLTWRGPSLQYELLDPQRNTPGLQIGLDLAPNQLDTEDSPLLTDLDDRDFSFLAGVTYNYPTRAGTLSARLQTNISGKHDGQRATLGFERTLARHTQGKWAVTGGVELEYLSEDYADYYFGVSADEAARTAFSFYEVDSVVQPAATLGGYYAFNQRWQLIGNLRVQSLASDIKDSPIVDASTSVDGFFGVVYNF